MHMFVFVLGLALSLVGPTIGAAQDSSKGSKPELHNLHDVQRALASCLRPLSLPEPFPGIRLTLRFSFNGRGEFRGPPEFTFVTPLAPEKYKDEYRSAILHALARCVPLNFSPDLGAAIAGRPIVLQFNTNGLVTV
jgi:hypothetical protein